jgi:mannose-6-phosphate isomerase-like protein (cupin superfamily)
MNQTIVTAADEVIRIGDLEIRYLSEAAGGCRMGCFEMRVAPNGSTPPPHSHPGHEELVYVLEGTLRYRVGENTRDLGPGDSMATPCGEVHSFSNPHAEPVRALVINTPDIGADYFREIASIMGAGGPPDKAAVVATMRKFGLVPASPASVGR